MLARPALLTAAALALLGAAAAVAAEPVPTTARLVVDAAGDANGLTAVPDAPSTAPASVDSADVRYVDVDRTPDGLRVRFGLTATPDPEQDGALVFYRLTATLGACRFHLGALTGGVDTTGSDAARGVQPFFDPASEGCPDEGLLIRAEPSWTGVLDAEAAEIVLDFPLESLPAHVPGLAPGATLTDVGADVAAGTYAFAFGAAGAQERYVTAVLDAAPGGLDYVVPCLEQQC